MDYYSLSAKGVLKELNTSKTGLSNKEAEVRLAKYGHNLLPRKSGPGLVEIFLSQFKNFVVLILLFAAIVSGLVGEWIDAILIFAIVFFNSVLGTYQEYKAERSLEALAAMTAPTAKVIRNGKESVISASKLVPGDIIVLETGDRVPADARIIEEFNLKCDESSLTGESVPHSKHTTADDDKTPLADRKSMLFMATIISYGHGIAVVTGTGTKTEMGNISALLSAVESRQTPLQEKLEEVGKKLGVGVLLISMLLIAIELWKDPVTLSAILNFTPDLSVYFSNLADTALLALFLVAVSLAVAAIPEGLPAVVTITLALSLQHMAKRNALVRKLPAVETLGSTTVICSDKTGTLTRNEMTVTDIYVDGKFIKVTGSGYQPVGEFFDGKKKIAPNNSKTLTALLESVVHCNDARLSDNKLIGDPTEGSLIVLAGKAGLTQQFKRVDEVPFDSNRKKMTVVCNTPSGFKAYMKGATEFTLDSCDYIYSKGKKTKLTELEKKKIMDANDKMARKALRVLAVAYKPLTTNYHKKKMETGLIFLGLVGMIDPPRTEVIEAIKLCSIAGINVVMITGDNALTAEAVAKEIGLSTKKVITGADLDELGEVELADLVPSVSVYARVSPEHKLRIVRAWQSRGEVVAVTGDGVNDAPALKTADIGIAMGITGTDVSKEASDMVLRDDNFASIVSAIEEGRRVYDNIRSFLRFLLSANIVEVGVVAIGALAGLPLPLTAVQLLWINLVTDGVPAIALGFDAPDPRVMERKPRTKKESVFAGFMPRMGYVAVIFITASLFVYWIGLAEGVEKARTMVFTLLVLLELVFVFNVRPAVHSFFHGGLTSNRLLLASVFVGISLQVMVVQLPFFNVLFDTVPLTAIEWIFLVGVSSIAALPFLGNMWSLDWKKA